MDMGVKHAESIRICLHVQWLSTAISFTLEDETKNMFDRCQFWPIEYFAMT